MVEEITLFNMNDPYLELQGNLVIFLISALTHLMVICTITFAQIISMLPTSHGCLSESAKIPYSIFNM